MVLGMSGRSGEPRRGNPQVKKEKSSSENVSQQTTQPTQKFKPPSAEQVHIARILEETTPADIDNLVRKVLSVVNRPEEDINIALHDNDYNVEKTIEALLDSSSSTQEEWTTMATSKKGRKKQQESEDQTSRGKGNSWLRDNKGNRSGGNKPRESSSGNITTETTETKVIREDQTSRGSRGRPYNSGRGPKRYNNNREGRKDRDFRTDRGLPYGRKKEWNSSNIHHAPAIKLSEDNWREDEEPVSSKSTGWESKLVSTPPVDESWGGEEEWVIVDPPTSSEQGDFPVAFPQGGVSSSSSSPPRDDHTCTTYIEDKRSLNSPSQDNIPLKSNKTRRYRSSRIPSQPVEMPRWIDTLTLEFGTLGVDFVGSETTPTTNEPASSPTVLLSNQTFQEIPPSSPQVTSASPLINTTHYTTSLSEDDAVIAMSTATFSETPPTKLDPPPGLTHPSQHSTVAPATTGLLSGPPDPISMPPQPTNKLEGLLTSGSTGTANLPSVSFSLSLPVTTGPSTLGTTPNFSAAGSTSQAEPLFSTQSTSVTIVTNPIPSSHHVSTSSVVMTTTGNNKTGVTHSGKVHSNVHPMAATGMVYPHVLHQFPHYGTAPMMLPTYPYDVETLNRYQGFYSQHQTTQDQTGLSGAGVGGRGDHPTSSFSSDSKYDMTSSVVGATNPNNTQQQGALQNHPFYNPYIYTMYGPHLSMPGYSAQMGHKHGGATSYPVGSSYQPTPQGQYGLTYEEEYTKLYGGSAMPKTNSVPSTSTGSEFPGYSKYDTKGGGAYSSYVPTGPPMGGYMMTPHVPPQMGGPIMTTPHDASLRSKHTKTYWNPTHT